MRHDRSQPSALNGFQRGSATCILASYRKMTGNALLPDGESGDSGRDLYDAPLVVLAHDTAPDPVFFYANQCAQHLFEMTWTEMISLPSRNSAEPLARQERDRLLARVSRHGFIDDYSGVRVSKTGRRFLIERAVVWNLVDHHGACHGQAAMFSRWIPQCAAVVSLSDD
jgi:hypothetical protein